MTRIGGDGQSGGGSGRFYVLGASGYFGGAIAAELEKKVAAGQVLRLRSIDELERRGVDLSSQDTLINCVGYFGSECKKMFDANVDHARSTAERAGAAGASLVHVSSMAVFDAVLEGRITEEDPLKPRSRYGVSKAHGEEIVADLVPTAQIVRPAKVFGGSDPRRRLQSLSRHVRRGGRLPIPATPILWANFVWIVDAARVLAEEVLNPGESRVIHLATPLRWATFAMTMGEAFGVRVNRAHRSLEIGAHVSATAFARIPGRPPRPIEKLLEIWDRREFVDSAARFPTDSVRRGLFELAGAR